MQGMLRYSILGRDQFVGLILCIPLLALCLFSACMNSNSFYLVVWTVASSGDNMIKQHGGGPHTLRDTPLSKKANALSSPRSHSTPRSTHTTPHAHPVNPIVTLSHKDKLLLTSQDKFLLTSQDSGLKKAPSKQAISAASTIPPPSFKFSPQDYVFDQDDQEDNIVLDGNVIKAASMCLSSFNLDQVAKLFSTITQADLAVYPFSPRLR